MLTVGIVGGTGYTGAELLRLLSVHPEVNIAAITSRSHAGTPVDVMYPSLRGYIQLAFAEPEAGLLAACDVVFFATPNGTAMELVPELLERGTRVIDLAADFRLKDVTVWEQYYGMKHVCPDLLREAVYGLPELNRQLIKEARLIANPGCYPTAVSLGFMPLLTNGTVDSGSLIADVKSGASGAGRQAKVANLYGEVAEDFHAYGVAGHRHLPEIRQTLSQVAGYPVHLVFVPHLVPMVRGIHATLYARLTEEVDLQMLFEDYYRDEWCVDVMPAGSHPGTGSVRGSNSCRLAVHRPGNGETVVVLAVEDNLVKGAAGQAVQNMNIMFGLEESLGLTQAAVWP